MAEIILDVHRLVDIHRGKKGMPPINWKDREYIGETVVSEIIVNSGDNFKQEGINELPPNCQCSPTCDKQVRRSPRGGGWNKYAFGHNPNRGTGGAKNNNSLPDDFQFTVKVFGREQYEQTSKVKDQRILKLLSAVNAGDSKEITVVYLEDDKLKPVKKQLERAAGILKFHIDVSIGDGHLALSKQA